MTKKLFLDTGALIALSGLKGKELESFKEQLETSNSELSVTHIQVDEKTTTEVQPYKSKINKAMRSLTNKGIIVHLEDSKITVFGISRFGYTRFGYEEMHKLDDKLRKEIIECEKIRGRSKPLLNVARDTAIAVSSLDHDFFIVCDKCLFESWLKVIGKQRKLGQRFKLPRIVYARPYPNEVAKTILELLS